MKIMIKREETWGIVSAIDKRINREVTNKIKFPLLRKTTDLQGSLCLRQDSFERR